MSEYITAWLDYIDMSHVREEIVRCRDCKRFDSKREGCWWFTHYEQRSNYSWEEVPADVEPDGFCKWGEVRGA